MKLGRLILTHREKVVDTFKKFYLDAGRTEFLVVACNQKTVDVPRFSSTDSFKVVPYCPGGPEGSCSATGKQYQVWVGVVKQFPDIEGWVIHDYDFVCRVSDKEIFSHIGPNEYAMIGKAFPVWQEGMSEHEHIDTYPFIQDHRHTHRQVPPHPTDVEVFAKLMNAFPHYYKGIKTLLCGYGDFIATTRENVLLLDDPKIHDLTVGGNEQVPHTVWGAKGVKPVDMHPHYAMKVLLDVMYVPMDARYTMIHPAKVWEGEPITMQDRMRNAKRKLKNFVKWLIGYKGWKRV